jgi:hypothetical protein
MIDEPTLSDRIEPTGHSRGCLITNDEFQKSEMRH